MDIIRAVCVLPVTVVVYSFVKRIFCRGSCWHICMVKLI